MPVGPRAVSVFVSVAEEEECSWCSSQCPRVVSVFVVAIVRRQVARRFVEFVEFEYYCARASEIR